MIRYFKLKPGCGAKFVEVKTEKNGVFSGTPVNKFGEDTSTLKNDVLSEFLIVFGKSDIAYEMTMNLHYGELERK